MVPAVERTIRCSTIIVCTVTLIDIAQPIVNTVGETNTVMIIQVDIQMVVEAVRRTATLIR